MSKRKRENKSKENIEVLIPSSRSERLLKRQKTVEAEKEELRPTLPESAAEIAVSGTEISEYERKRLENIRRNEMFLSELGVAGVTATMRDAIPKKKVTPRKPAAKPTPAIPTRRSSRVTVDRLTAEVKSLKDEGKLEEAASKEEELKALVEKQKEGTYVAEFQAAPEERYERLPRDPIPLSAYFNKTDEEEEDSSYWTEVHDLLSVSTKKKSKPSKNEKYASTSKEFAKFQMTEEDVKKLTPARITAVGLSPATDYIVAVAGDKYGNIGLWNATTGSTQRVYQYKPHISNVIHFHFSLEDYGKLFSVSYDGTIRCLDSQQDAFLSTFEIPEALNDLWLTDCAFLYDRPNTAVISKSNGYVSGIDFRVSNSTYQWDYEAQDYRINSIQQHPLLPHLLITAGTKNGGIAIHDLRMIGKKWKPLQFFSPHSKSVNNAQVSPDGKYLLSLSLDDTIRVTTDFLSTSSSASSSSSKMKSIVYRHNNFTGRWLSTFRPVFDPKRDHTFVCGSMLQPRRLEIFTIQENAKAIGLDLTYNLQSDWFASVNSRNCFHPTLEMVLGSNSSGKVHLFRAT